MPAVICAVAAYAVLAVASVRLSTVDLRVRRLPNRLLAGFGAGFAGLLLASAALGGDWPGFGRAVACGAGYGAVALLLGLA
ncbi:MAG: prepilin peptidase, partial [Leucobacter sp.]